MPMRQSDGRNALPDDMGPERGLCHVSVMEGAALTAQYRYCSALSGPKAVGIAVPPRMLALADEVIE